MKRTAAIGFISEYYLWHYHWEVDPSGTLDLYRKACLIRRFETAAPDA